MSSFKRPVSQQYLFYDKMLNYPNRGVQKEAQRAKEELGRVDFTQVRRYAGAAGNNLIRRADSEFEKEKRLLASFYAMKPSNVTEENVSKLVRYYSHMLSIYDMFETASSLLHKEINTIETAAERNTVFSEEFQSKHFSLFVNDPEVNSAIDTFIQSTITMRGQVSKLRDSLVRRAQELIFQIMEEEIQKQTYDISSSWALLQKAVQEVNKLRQQTSTNILENYNFDSLEDQLKELTSDSAKQAAINLANTIKAELKEKMKTRTKDSLEEFSKVNQEDLARAFSVDFVKAMITGTDWTYVSGPSRGTIDLGTKISSIDFTHTISDSNIDAGELRPGRSKLTARLAFKKFGEEVAKIDKSAFIVYVNSRELQRGGGFKGASLGVGDHAADLVEMSNLLGADLDRFISSIINMQEGAMVATFYPERKEQLEKALAGSVANFFFDDWTTIGDTSSNAIHILRLSSRDVPLSIVLRALGEAILRAVTIDDYKEYLQIKLSFPTPLYMGMSDFEREGYEKSQKRWDNERKNASDVRMTVTILRNFEDILKGELF